MRKLNNDHITLIKKEKTHNISFFFLIKKSFCKNIESPHPMMLVRLVKIWRTLLKAFVNVFSLFHFYSPWKRACPFIWINLNPVHPGMLCAKLDWNWPSGSEEKVKSVQKNKRNDRQTEDIRRSGKLRWAKRKVLKFL